jgi:hypothetical protein
MAVNYLETLNKKGNNMLNKTNVIGAVVLLKHCHVMPNNTPLQVVDYSKGDCGSGYLPMIMVTDNKVFEWVRLRSVKSVLEVGQPFEDNKNINLLLKQIKHFTTS